MYDVVALGEMLIDFTPVGVSANHNPIFERNPGGAPSNMLCMLAKLGCSAGFIGKVGNDPFGHALKQTLDDNGVSSQGMVLSDEYQTTLAFVHLSETGDRSFSFYRNHTADVMLTPEEVNRGMIDDCRIFHFGSVSMTAEPSRSATFAAAEYAREKGKLISYDPNLRLNLWESAELAKEWILKGVTYANILKLSEEELVFLTGCTDFKQGAQELLDRYENLKVVLISLGGDGALALNRECTVSMTAYPVKVADTTAAGDSFMGGFLYKMLHASSSPEALSQQELLDCLSFANATGSMTTTRKGSIHALPTMEEILGLMNS